MNTNTPRLPFFVYGTLLPGQPNYYLWADAIRSEQVAILPNGRLYDMAQLNLGHYPMLVEASEWQVAGRGGATGQHVAGNLQNSHRLPRPYRWQVVGMMAEVEPLYYATLLRTLDILEDYRPQQPDESFYHRARRIVTLTNGRQHVAWVYLGRATLVAGLEPIPGGNWKAYCATRQAEVEQWWAEGGRVPSHSSVLF